MVIRVPVDVKYVQHSYLLIQFFLFMFFKTQLLYPIQLSFSPYLHCFQMTEASCDKGFKHSTWQIQTSVQSFWEQDADVILSTVLQHILYQTLLSFYHKNMFSGFCDYACETYLISTEQNAALKMCKKSLIFIEKCLKSSPI